MPHTTKFTRWLDKASSFFVGDAAGRQYPKGKDDFSCSDRKWADNVQLTFYTPEVCDTAFLPLLMVSLTDLVVYRNSFLDLHNTPIIPCQDSVPLRCPYACYPRLEASSIADVSHFVTVPHVLPTSSPVLPAEPQQEVIIFVGYPSLGKSTFFKTYFEPAGYIHINQDTLKTRDKCVKALKEGLADGKSCVIGINPFSSASYIFLNDF